MNFFQGHIVMGVPLNFWAITGLNQILRGFLVKHKTQKNPYCMMIKTQKAFAQPANTGIRNADKKAYPAWLRILVKHPSPLIL
jgi:hypothetical protein